jgi:hypothetical protein
MVLLPVAPCVAEPLDVDQPPGFYPGVLVSGNIHQPSLVGSLVGVSLQWAMLAFLVSLTVTQIRARESKR